MSFFARGEETHFGIKKGAGEMVNIVLAIILVIVIGTAAGYLIRAKKRGVTCIGCPSGCNCSHKHDQQSECNCRET